MNLEIKNKTADSIAIRELKESDMPIIIYGNGEIADNIEMKLKESGIQKFYKAADRIEDTKAVKRDKLLTVDEVNEKFENCVIIPGFANAYKLTEEEMKHKFQKCKKIIYLAGFYSMENLDEAWLNENHHIIEKIHDDFSDDLSKKSLVAYINAKINLDGRCLLPYIEIPEYFSGDFLKLTDHETFVDCGAYDGDSIKNFLNHVDRYQQIFAFEPDKDNSLMLKKYIEKNKLSNIAVIEKATYDTATTLRWRNEGTMVSNISDDGESIIETDTIDHIVGNAPVTFIKMDIEGAEEKAILGAKNTIIKNKPILGISIYHKRNDLINIYQLLKDWVPEYKFYFRVHLPVAAGAVLYATI